MKRLQILLLTATVLALGGCETYHGLTRDLHRAEQWLDTQSEQLGGSQLQEAKGPTHHR
ncbi:MAG: hypothetical protein J7K75_06550 [Desulfuromonas sp.]|nr:hypothetical protein [Desulfuromonas sp.]